MPFNPKAVPEIAFVSAEAVGRPFQAVKEKAHGAEPTPAEAEAIVNDVLPLVPATPVDIEKAGEVARSSRGGRSLLLPGRA
jgi:hypothetical protein